MRGGGRHAGASRGSQIPQVPDNQIRSQAIAWAQHAGWVVQIAGRLARIVASDALQVSEGAGRLDRADVRAAGVQCHAWQTHASGLSGPTDRGPGVWDQPL